MEAVNAAKWANINNKWYAQYLHPKSLNEKYRFGYWVQFYLFYDLLVMAEQAKNEDIKENIIHAYLSGSWDELTNL